MYNLKKKYFYFVRKYITIQLDLPYSACTFENTQARSVIFNFLCHCITEMVQAAPVVSRFSLSSGRNKIPASSSVKQSMYEPGGNLIQTYELV